MLINGTRVCFNLQVGCMRRESVTNRGTSKNLGKQLAADRSFVSADGAADDAYQVRCAELFDRAEPPR